MAPLPIKLDQISNDVHTVPVSLGARSYGIQISDGLIHSIGPILAKECPDARMGIISDETVAGLHYPALAASLDKVGISYELVTVPPGEGSKSFSTLNEVTNRILEYRLERGDYLLALGGGVVGDLTGFAAAIIRRGMGFIQCPTTLLAQVDSSVGGKTGINTAYGKNLLGAFYQPDIVFIDPSTLDSLPQRQFAAGYAEVVKYGLIDDPALFQWLENNWQDIFAGGPARREAIAKSCAAKARVVIADERETGQRALLNFGHTFAHALEAETDFSDRLFHGEAVAVGMAMAHRFSRLLNIASEDDAERVEKHLRAVGLPTRIYHIDGNGLRSDALFTHMCQDKKAEQGQIVFILTKAIGSAFINRSIAPDMVHRFLADECK